MAVKIQYNTNELAFVKANCTLQIKELHKLFCNAFNRFDVSAQNLNALRKRNKWRTGRTGQFEKGAVSHNKGRKGWHAPGSEKGWFKKGVEPVNTLDVGTIREHEDGYLEIKTAPGNRQWRLLQRVIWERCNGKIPAGYVITFIDNNKKNCDLTNLTLLTNAENLKRNSIYNYPDELVQLIQLKGAIKRQINKRTKHEQYSNA